MLELEFKGKTYNVIFPTQVVTPRHNVLGLDIETGKLLVDDSSSFTKEAGRDPHQSYIRLVQIFDNENTVYVYDSHTFNLKLLKPLLEDPSKKFIAHSARFELKHLRKLGIENINIHDTLLMAQLINGAAQDVWEPSEHDEDTPNTEKSGLTRYKRPGVSLEFLVAQYLDTQILKAQQTSNWNAEKLSDEQIKYAALDAVVTVLLAFKLLPILNAEKMMEVYKLQCLSLIAICEMEYLGVKVDWDQHSRLVRSWEEGLHQAEVQTNLFFGDINKGLS